MLDAVLLGQTHEGTFPPKQIQVKGCFAKAKGEHQSSGGYKEVGPSWEDHIKARVFRSFPIRGSVSV